MKKVVGSVLHTEECTAYMHYTMSLMTEVAKELGKNEDEVLFREYADGAKSAYNYLFLQSGSIDTDRQAKLVRPLALGLLEKEKKENVQNRLAKAVENRNYRIGTGFLSTPFILSALTEVGRADLAYKMLENEEAPSWLAEVNAGATTIWENWEGDVSHNHYSPGAVCEWIFDTVGGIRIAGENRFLIKPLPGGSLKFAETEYNSMYGKVISNWKKTEKGYRFEIVIPANTTAEIELSKEEKYEVGSGSYMYEIFINHKI